jgi:hypothetical protein
MSKGFLTVAQNTSQVDYVRLAYVQALSIKATQPTINKYAVMVTPGTVIPDRYRQVFDEVIDVPWGDMSSSTRKFENEWKTYHITPWSDTIKVESDMLFTSDITDWWNLLDTKDLWFTSDVRTYRNEIITSRACRELFDNNRLPNLYNGFMFFKKCDFAHQFFKSAEIIFKNFAAFSMETLDKPRPLWPDTDTVYAMAVKLLDIESLVMRRDLSIPTFVHMKAELQNWMSYNSYDWTNQVHATLTDSLELKINMCKQNLPFHYHVKSFITEEIIGKYERYLGI